MDAEAALAAYVETWVEDHTALMATIKRQDYRKTAKRRRATMRKRESAKLPGFRDEAPSVDEIVEGYERWDDPDVWREILIERHRETFLYVWKLRALVRERVTPEQFETMVSIRDQAYPKEPSYGLDFWVSVLHALAWCPQPMVDDRIRFWDWMEGRLVCKR